MNVIHFSHQTVLQRTIVVGLTFSIVFFLGMSCFGFSSFKIWSISPKLLNVRDFKQAKKNTNTTNIIVRNPVRNKDTLKVAEDHALCISITNVLLLYAEKKNRTMI